MIKILAALALFVSSSALADNMFKGDEKLACEAKMCLSVNATRPNECEAPVRRYCQERARKPHDTARMRDAFLRKCPDNGRRVPVHPPC